VFKLEQNHCPRCADILNRLDARDAHNDFQTRIADGGAANAGNTSYFDSGSEFDVARYSGTSFTRDISIYDRRNNSSIPLLFYPAHEVGAIAASL